MQAVLHDGHKLLVAEVVVAVLVKQLIDHVHHMVTEGLTGARLHRTLEVLWNNTRAVIAGALVIVQSLIQMTTKRYCAQLSLTFELAQFI